MFASSFALMQKKQKIKDNPIAPRVCPAYAPTLFALACLYQYSDCGAPRKDAHTPCTSLRGNMRLFQKGLS